jgi:hypothetical protein
MTTTPNLSLQEALEKQKAQLAEQLKPKWECYDMSERDAFDQLLICILGDRKTGKSRLAATAPGPVLFLDVDRRRQAVSGIKGVYAITLKDPASSQMQPTVVPAIEDILSRLEKSKNDLHSVMPSVPEGTIIRTIVFDSATSISSANLRYTLYTNPGSRRELTASPTNKFWAPSHFDGWMADPDQTQKYISNAYALGLNTILIAHTRAEEADQSTLDRPLYTGKITIDPPRYKSIMGYFNEVWLMELVNVPGTAQLAHKVRVKQGINFNSATCLELDPVQDPNICDMIQKHIAKRKIVVK